MSRRLLDRREGALYADVLELSLDVLGDLGRVGVRGVSDADRDRLPGLLLDLLDQLLGLGNIGRGVAGGGVVGGAGRERPGGGHVQTAGVDDAHVLGRADGHGRRLSDLEIVEGRFRQVEEKAAHVRLAGYVVDVVDEGERRGFELPRDLRLRGVHHVDVAHLEAAVELLGVGDGLVGDAVQIGQAGTPVVGVLGGREVVVGCPAPGTRRDRCRLGWSGVVGVEPLRLGHEGHLAADAAGQVVVEGHPGRAHGDGHRQGARWDMVSMVVSAGPVSAAAFWASKLATSAAPSQGVPLWNTRLGRRVMVHAV